MSIAALALEHVKDRPVGGSSMLAMNFGGAPYLSQSGGVGF
jgi:hypothetical protein